MYTLKKLVEQRKEAERIQQEAIDKENKQKFEELIKYLHKHPTGEIETKNNELARMAREFGLLVSYGNCWYVISIPKEIV
jgi:hypothetical protein